LLGSLPEDFETDLGKSELTLEVSARSNLEVVVVSGHISALDDLTIDGFNVSFPRVKVSGVEVVFEVGFVRVSVGSSVSLRKTVIFADDKLRISSKLFNMDTQDVVKVTAILTEGFCGQIDLDLDIIFDGGNSCLNVIFKGVNSSADFCAN
jgi:hypothetical protein